jgi:hypothetical protein
MNILSRAVALTLGLIIAACSLPNRSQASSYEEKAETIAADVFVYRPAGVILTAGGTALFVLILPATLIAGGTRDTAKTLVKTPFNFTFRRPIGTELDDYLEY